MSEKRKRIQLLPEHLINQIKAGEVIDRPASLLKEILENSLDAESTQIQLHLVENGLNLIALEDNGKGMSLDDLPLAFARHATSKLDKFEDLYSLSSFGFRGEALASIASIARINCSSAPREDLSLGGKILIEGGEEKSLVPYTNSQSGTSLYIKDLFYNTPARLKFIKSKVAEKNSIKRILHSFLLAHPQVNFSLRFDDKEKQFFPKASSLKERVVNVLVSKGKEEDVINFEESYEGYTLKAFFIPSESALTNNNYLFINKRFFIDKGLHQALMGNLEQLRPGQSYHYACFLEAPADEIDVNVHPSKTEVKFFKSGIVYSLLSASLKKHFKKETSPSPLFEEASPFYSDSHPQQNETSFSPHSTYIQKEQEAQAYTWKLLGSIPLHYQLIQTEDQFYLLNVWAYVCQVFRDDVLNKLPLKEDHIIPLLVSEPYKAQAQINLEALKELGFELDKLSEETLVLRTIPEALRRLPYRRFVQELLNTKDPNQLEQRSLQESFYLFENQLSPLMSQKEHWLKNKVLLPLNEEQLKKIF